MTLILAGKYRDGIVVAYDMAQGALFGDGMLFNRLVDKALPTWNRPGKTY